MTIPENLASLIDSLFDVLAKSLRMLKHVFISVRAIVRIFLSKFLAVETESNS